MKDILEKVKFNEKGLVPAVVQDIDSKEVLMVAYMNAESLQKTIETGKACFWSRSRQELWLKGETSGNYQLVKEMRIDCDNDTMLLLVEPAGPACHTGRKSCFYHKLIDDNIEEISEIKERGSNTLLNLQRNKQDSKDNNLTEKQDGISEEKLEKARFLYKLYNLVADRKENPVEGSYTNYLFTEGVDKICKKVGEEAAEVIIGAKNGSKDEMVYEISDLIYHLMVLMNLYEIPLTDIFEELEGRNNNN